MLEYTCPDILGGSIALLGDQPCVIGQHRSFTFAEVDNRANRVVSLLAQLDVRRGQSVALLSRNDPEFFELQLGCQRAGVTLATLNFWLAIPELQELLGRINPRALLHGSGLGEVASALDVRPTLHLGPDGAGISYERLLVALPITRASPIVPDAIVTLLFTSGTSGRAKSVPITNRVLFARQLQAALEIPIRPGDVFLQPQPMFHMASQINYAASLLGATTVLVQRFDPATVAEALTRYRVTHLQTVPTMLGRFVEEVDLEALGECDLRMVLYGAAPMPEELLRQTMAGFPGCQFLQWFGMTETSASSVLRPSDHDVERPEHLRSVGTDATFATTRILHEDGEECAPEEHGEIVCRGSCVFGGYLDEPSETAPALRDGWMHTGDLGYRSKDGYLYLTGRRDDKIVSGGENVYPAEVEAVLSRHPAVLEVAVVGRPDDRWGEAVHAYVVLRSEASASVDDLQRFCRSDIASYKTPKDVHFVEGLPKNSMGKTLRRLLRDNPPSD